LRGLDTNVLVRFFAKDDPSQSPRVAAYIRTLTREDPGFIPLAALIELVWVMRRSYRADKAEIAGILEMLLRTPEFIVENAETANQALIRFRGSKADYSDCLIQQSAHNAGCAFTVTFDETAASTAGMRLI
jgi:predicted nucleic-acid-binding protein